MEIGDAVHSLDVRPNPKIEYTGEVKDEDYYTLLMVGKCSSPPIIHHGANRFVLADIDYPRRDKPTEAEYMHWLIPNIKPDPMRKHKATGEQALVGYMPPTPVANSGK